MAFRLFAAAVSLSIGNFLYQAFSSQLWAVACDRSFFEAVALTVAYFACLPSASQTDP